MTANETNSLTDTTLAPSRMRSGPPPARLRDTIAFRAPDLIADLEDRAERQSTQMAHAPSMAAADSLCRLYATIAADLNALNLPDADAALIASALRGHDTLLTTTFNVMRHIIGGYEDAHLVQLSARTTMLLLNASPMRWLAIADAVERIWLDRHAILSSAGGLLNACRFAGLSTHA